MRYEKGRKDATRQRIVDIAAEHFRCDGIAATGLAGIMKDAGLTNGAFYPHFQSKAELVRESVATAMDGQAGKMREIMAAGGLEAAIAAYLSAEHRDSPGQGCTLAALSAGARAPATRDAPCLCGGLAGHDRRAGVGAAAGDFRIPRAPRSASTRRSSAPSSSPVRSKEPPCRIGFSPREPMRHGRWRGNVRAEPHRRPVLLVLAQASFPTRFTRSCWKAIRRAAPAAPAIRPPSPVALPRAPPWTDRLRGKSGASSRLGPRRSRS